MKKLLFWIVLMVGTVVLLGSCAKKDSTTVDGNIAGTGTTPSGTLGGYNFLTGTYHTSWNGQEPSGGCVDNSSAIAAHSYLASDTLSFKKMWIITGTSSFTDSYATYSDANCSTLTGYYNKLADNVTMGNNLGGLTVGSSPTKPSQANHMSYTFTKYSLMANTTATIANFQSRYGVTLTSGVEKIVDEDNLTTEYNIIAATHIPTGSTTTYLFWDEGSSSDNYTDWGSNTNTYWNSTVTWNE